MEKTLTSRFFTDNRKKLKTLLGDGPPIVLTAHGLLQRSNDSEYRFEQDRNFFYLSGLNEPDWILVIDGSHEYLIAPEISDTERLFNGEPDFEIIRQISGIEDIIESKKGWKILKDLNSIRTIVVSEDKLGSIFINPSKKSLLAKLDAKTKDITAELLHLRTIKSKPEIAMIREAINITDEGFRRASKIIDEAQTEAELEAVFTGHFTTRGVCHGYTPIVASGKNACTLHYTSNNQKLAHNTLVLIDIGAQYQYYSADITRTLIRGVPTDRQKEVKEAVGITFEEILNVIKPGLAFKEYQKRVDEIMTDTISRLGFGNSSEARQKYFPHAPSHGLGLDVHDALVGFDSFQPGMIITLEPGVYIPEEGVGVRYEDDLLITSDGVDNLSQMIKDKK